MLLAIDTSTTWTGLACYNDSGMIGEASWLSGRDHTAQLLPQLTLLLRHLGKTRDSISAIGVALGPGSWSGLRVGLSTAKGLALARSLPVIGIGTLEALAYQHRRRGTTVIPLLRLGRERFATTGVDTREPRNVGLAELCAELNGRALFCGDIDGGVREILQEHLGERATFPTPSANVRRAGFLAELAWQRLQAGEADDIATLEPIYLGQPVKSV
jgi:tRNA threonylcarbamoyladenosine biosynthesis protein TsaB